MSIFIAVLLAAAPTLAQQQAAGLDLEQGLDSTLQTDAPMKAMVNTVIPEVPGGDFFTRLINAGTCFSDVTATGRVVSKQAHLTPNRKTIFTVYEFAVETAHRGGPLDSTIYLLRRGGAVDGYSITYSDQPPFEVNARYLVYLTRKEGYFQTSPFDWLIDNNTVAPIGKNLTRDPDTRFPLAQAVARTTCVR
jgi:hypothetical protein